MLIGSAAMTNVRRIQCYLAAKQEQENECNETKRREDITWDQKVISFCASLMNYPVRLREVVHCFFKLSCDL